MYSENYLHSLILLRNIILVVQYSTNSKLFFDFYLSYIYYKGVKSFLELIKMLILLKAGVKFND